MVQYLKVALLIGEYQLSGLYKGNQSNEAKGLNIKGKGMWG